MSLEDFSEDLKNHCSEKEAHIGEDRIELYIDKMDLNVLYEHMSVAQEYPWNLQSEIHEDEKMVVITEGLEFKDPQVEEAQELVSNEEALRWSEEREGIELRLRDVTDKMNGLRLFEELVQLGYYPGPYFLHSEADPQIIVFVEAA